MSEQPHGPTQHHQPEKSGNPDKPGMMGGKNKWYLIGGLTIVAALVFVFVRKSNSNAATGSSTTTTSGLDPTTESMLQQALQGQAGQSYMGGATGAQGPAGPAGPAGPSTSVSNPNSQVTVGIPNGMLGWENIVFPSADAVSQWNAWNAAQTGPGPRSGINNELNSLGATGMIPMPTAPVASAPLGSPLNTGNPWDYK